MRIGFAPLDELTKAMVGLIELLNFEAMQTINNELFLLRLNSLEQSAKTVYKLEEHLMGTWQVPELIKQQHLDAHENILAMCSQVYFDCMNTKGRHQRDVYQEIRGAIENHLLDTNIHLSSFAPRV